MENRWEQYANLFGFSLILLGILVASEQIRLPVSRPLPLGMEMCGVGLCIAFMSGLTTGRIHSFFGRSFQWGYYEGLLARLWSGLMLLIGLAVAGGGLVEWRFPGILRSFLATPAGMGLGVIFLGLIVLLFSLVKVLQPVAQESNRITQVSHTLKRLFWMIILIAGVVIIGSGFLQLLMPDVVQRLVQQFLPGSFQP